MKLHTIHLNKSIDDYRKQKAALGIQEFASKYKSRRRFNESECQIHVYCLGD